MLLTHWPTQCNSATCYFKLNYYLAVWLWQNNLILGRTLCGWNWHNHILQDMIRQLNEMKSMGWSSVVPNLAISSSRDVRGDITVPSRSFHACSSFLHWSSKSSTYSSLLRRWRINLLHKWIKVIFKEAFDKVKFLIIFDVGLKNFRWVFQKLLMCQK